MIFMKVPAEAGLPRDAFEVSGGGDVRAWRDDPNPFAPSIKMLIGSNNQPMGICARVSFKFGETAPMAPLAATVTLGKALSACAYAMSQDCMERNPAAMAAAARKKKKKSAPRVAVRHTLQMRTAMSVKSVPLQKFLLIGTNSNGKQKDTMRARAAAPRAAAPKPLTSNELLAVAYQSASGSESDDGGAAAEAAAETANDAKVLALAYQSASASGSGTAPANALTIYQSASASNSGGEDSAAAAAAAANDAIIQDELTKIFFNGESAANDAIIQDELTKIFFDGESSGSVAPSRARTHTRKRKRTHKSKGKSKRKSKSKSKSKRKRKSGSVSEKRAKRVKFTVSDGESSSFHPSASSDDDY
jgi:hypothetical protein